MSVDRTDICEHCRRPIEVIGHGVFGAVIRCGCCVSMPEDTTIVYDEPTPCRSSSSSPSSASSLERP